jgi:hypothetical protein
MKGKYKQYNGMTRKDLIDSVILWIEIYDKSFDNYIKLNNKYDKLVENSRVVVQETATGDEEIITTAYNSKAVRDLAGRINKKNNGKQWIDLDIDNLPSRFFTRDDIEITNKDSNSSFNKLRSEIKERTSVIINMNYGVKYRYRIKESNDIKIGDWVRHNYCKTPTLELFQVGRIDGDKIYNYDESIITQNSKYVYAENCTIMTAEQKVYMDVWNNK